MDADKLNEAAEDIANRYGFDDFNKDSVDFGFKAGADWLMTQPLADRLTDEEITELIADFNRCKLLANKDYRDGRIVTYVNIFGKELFNEK